MVDSSEYLSIGWTSWRNFNGLADATVIGSDPVNGAVSSEDGLASSAVEIVGHRAS